MPRLAPSEPASRQRARSTYAIPVSDLDATTAMPVISPLPTVIGLLLDTLGARGSRSAPAAVRRAVVSELRPRDVAALAPLRPQSGIPNQLTATRGGGTFEDDIEAVASTPPEELVQGIAAMSANGLRTDCWRPALRSPKRWLEAYGEAMHRVWQGVGPVWRAAAGPMDREVERVSVATARGATRELLPRLYPGSTVTEKEWTLPSRCEAPGPLRLSPQVQLRPLVAPASAASWTDDDAGTVLVLCYPLPHVWRVFDGGHPPAASLEALLGQARAKVLMSLDRPMTAGRIAELLFAVPSAATHHVKALEAAGLVTRSRAGKHVLVSRTARGTDLLSLYDGERPARRRLS